MTEWTGQSLGGYLLEEELGHGSMGTVYRGTQLALDREVAVKLLPRHLSRDPSSVARFLREAHILAHLNHPNIVQIYDAGQHEEVLYLVLEYVQGLTIRSLLELDGHLPPHLAVDYVAQVADALEVAYHEGQVIHRDLKPENLMRDWGGRIKVMDFGLAKAAGLPPITTANNFMGSLYYASPEQVRGQPLDNRSDIYALGVVLYEMVTGARPCDGRSLQELARNITIGQVLSPTALVPEISPELEHIILTALATRRDERFARAGLMADALRALPLPSFSEPGSHQGRVSLFFEGEQSASDASVMSGQHASTPLIKGRLTLPMRAPHTSIPETPVPDDLTLVEADTVKRTAYDQREMATKDHSHALDPCPAEH